MELWYCVECGSVRFSNVEPVACVCQRSFSAPGTRTRQSVGEQPRFKLVYPPMSDEQAEDLARIGGLVHKLVDMLDCQTRSRYAERAGGQ